MIRTSIWHPPPPKCGYMLPIVVDDATADIVLKDYSSALRDQTLRARIDNAIGPDGLFWAWRRLRRDWPIDGEMIAELARRILRRRDQDMVVDDALLEIVISDVANPRGRGRPGGQTGPAHANSKLSAALRDVELLRHKGVSLKNAANEVAPTINLAPSSFLRKRMAADTRNLRQYHAAQSETDRTTATKRMMAPLLHDLLTYIDAPTMTIK